MNNFSRYFKHQILNKHPSWTLFFYHSRFMYFSQITFI